MKNNTFLKNIKDLNKNKYNFRAISKLKEFSDKEFPNKESQYKIKIIKDNLISLLYNNKPLTSAYAPMEEAKRLISQFIKDENMHIGIFLSIASFYHIEYFLSLNKNNKAIIIEKDIEAVKLILENIESELLENVIIILNEPIENILAFFNFYINDHDTKKIVYIRHVRASNINDESKSYYDDINICLASSIKEKLMSLTSNYYFAPIWSRNILYNMHFNKGYSIKTFLNFLKKDIPLLLISAGASIDNYIEKIRELSNTHFIIALSHAFNTLIKNNIKPNAVITTDGGFFSSIHLTELLKKENNDIKVFTTHSAYPFPLTNIDNERIFYFSHDESFEKILYPDTESTHSAESTQSADNNNISFLMQGSVIMPALRIAYMLNPKYILLAGCDFCHVDDKSHSLYSNAVLFDFLNSSKINTFESAKYKRLNNNQKINCYDNVLRDTSVSLISYMNHFDALIQELALNIDIFNLTKESAKINNVKDFDNYKNNVEAKEMIMPKITEIEIMEETINKAQLKQKIEEFIKNVSSSSSLSSLSDIDQISEIGNMISPWHIDELEKSRIKNEEFKEYIINWYNNIKFLL